LIWSHSRRKAIEATLCGERETATISFAPELKYDSLSLILSVLCSAIKMDSADVIHPEQARQSSKETVAFLVEEADEEEEVAEVAGTLRIIP
jgi:hypothetical protein